MVDDEDNVIPITARKRLEAVRATAEIRRPARFCAHAYVDLDEDERIVECRACKKRIDPFEALLKYAQKERHFVYATKELVDEKAKLEAEVDDLKRIRANLGAQIRRRTKPT